MQTCKQSRSPRFKNKAILIRLTPRTIAESFGDIRLLGRIFHKEAESAEIIAEQQRQLEVIARKVAKIPAEKHQRVIRLMGNDPMHGARRRLFPK